MLCCIISYLADPVDINLTQVIGIADYIQEGAIKINISVEVAITEGVTK